MTGIPVMQGLAAEEALSGPCKRTISSRISAEQKPLIYTFLLTLEISLEALMNLNFFAFGPTPLKKIPPR